MSQENRALQERVWQELRTNLRAAVKVKNHNLIVRLHDEAMDKFEEIGYPDYWQDWQRARDDVLMFRAHCQPFF